MTEVLLDTQVLIALALRGPNGLPKRAQKLLVDPRIKKFVCSLSIAEIAIKTAIGKLETTVPQVETLVGGLQAKPLAYNVRHANRLFDLPLPHREPFDRMLIAVAMAEDLPLVGGDDEFPAYREQGLKIVWN